MSEDAERILLVVAPYYADIVGELERGARRVIEAAGYKVDRVEVPGAFEIPPAVAAGARTGGYRGYVALGCVIRGETSHYDHICAEVSRSLMELSVRDGLAIGFGVLTVNNEAQARARAALDDRDKGGEAAQAALALIDVHRRYSDTWS